MIRLEGRAALCSGGGGGIGRAVGEALLAAGARVASLDREGRLAAYVFDGDLFLLELASSRFERLTRRQ